MAFWLAGPAGSAAGMSVSAAAPAGLCEGVPGAAAVPGRVTARMAAGTNGLIHDGAPLVRDTRERGYCLQPGMVFEDSWAIGVVVYDANQAPVASISIAALRSRLGPARSAMLGNRLMQASKELTAQLKP